MAQTRARAKQVTYKSDAAGGVTRNLHDKIGESVSVKDFGAVGDGIADDTVAIQAAFDSVAVGGGGTVLIDGEHIITARINVASDTTVIQTGGSFIHNIVTTEDIVGGRPSTDNGVFQCACGVTDVKFVGLDIRGPWYGVARPYRDNNIGINLSGRFDQFRLGTPKAGVSVRITITGCTIDGFGQSAIIADNVTHLKVQNNFLQNCGSDGLRMYGCLDFTVTGNSVQTISPGYDGVAPNLNVYGITATTVYQQPLSDYRASERGIISNNNVANCLTWKGLDTHGGRDIAFANNTVTDSHIAIGIDKGGLDDLGNLMPAERITIVGNILRNVQGDTNFKRAGITVFADGSAEAVIGKDVIIDSNYIEGFGGQTKDGGISLFNQRNVTVTNNTLVNNYYCGLFVALVCEHVKFSNNTVRNVLISGSGIKDGVTTASATGIIDISGNSFISDDGLGFRPILIPPTAGLDIFYYDNIESGVTIKGGIIRMAGGDVTRELAFGRVLAAGSFAGYGASVVKSGTGWYTITLTPTDPHISNIFPRATAFTGTANLASATIRSVSGLVFSVQTFNSEGVAADTSFYFNVNGY